MLGAVASIKLHVDHGRINSESRKTDPVNRAVDSVMRRCSTGHVVVFKDDGCQCCVLNFWVIPNKGQGLDEAPVIQHDERRGPKYDRIQCVERSRR